jgi:hypothetical protein
VSSRFVSAPFDCYGSFSDFGMSKLLFLIDLELFESRVNSGILSPRIGPGKHPVWRWMNSSLCPEGHHEVGMLKWTLRYSTLLFYPIYKCLRTKLWVLQPFGS